MTTSHQRSPLSQSEWNELFALLSLDSVLELYPYVTLTLKDAAAFHRSLQSCIQAARERQEEVIAGRITASEMILRCLHSKMGEDFTNFLQWLKEAFVGSHSEQPQVSAWEIVFSQWANGRDLPADVAPEKMNTLVKEHRTRCSRADLNARVNAIKQRQLSDWDIEMYARHSWNHFDDVNDPFITLRLMASVNCTRKILESVIRMWTPEELAALTRGAQAVVNTLGVWMPGPVLTPEEALQA